MANENHFLDDLGTSVITVNVGSGTNLKAFTVHEKLLCERSEFFRTTLNGKWKESDVRVVDLPEDDPATFALYVQCLYAGHITQRESDGTSTAKFITMGNVFALAQKMVDVTTQNIVITSIYHRTQSAVCPEGKHACEELIQMINIIWEVLPEQSPARDCLVGIFTAYHMSCYADADEVRELENWMEDLPSDYLARVAVGLLHAYSYRVHDVKSELSNYLLPVAQVSDQGKRKG
ncbi:hypothetical protein CC80DRAFT_539715 [Byssothecium circinans]|uniref:BTB domain-containing protein n=1 Tax=Byssothecium circinans TaxID=147558 RepID=A0A6A5TDC3_9PLEO|nr:hypothetical protein CC80DRAFT_539715 [Byssothecium circinans]